MRENIWKKNEGIYFGYGSEELEGAPPPFTKEFELGYTDDRHVITIGPSGSGKSRRLLVPNLERLVDWSIVVIDPKGELAAMTAAHRRAHGNNVIIINPFDVLKLGSQGFNPVAALDKDSDDFPDDAFDIAQALIRVEGSDPHWAESAQDLLTALIMYSRLEEPHGGSLGQVRRNLGLPSDEFMGLVAKISLAAQVHEMEEMAIKVGRFAEIAPEDREIKSVLATALTQTRWLDSRPMKEDLEKPPIDFSILKERPTTVYLTLPARRLGTHSTWLRLMIASIIQPLMKDTRPAKVPTLFMLDEFAQLGHLPVIENNLALMRGYYLKLWTILQDMSQGQAIYKDRWESFIGNTGVLQSFAPQDTTTADYLSKRAGVIGKPIMSVSVSHPAGQREVSSESVSVGPQGLPALLPQEIRAMDPGFGIIFSHTNKRTLKAFAPYPTALPHLKAICALDPSARTAKASP
jgi:type IV secretion system protein VirD4